MRIAPSDASYKTFSEMVTGYRMLALVRHAVRLGVIEAVGPEGRDAAGILQETGLLPGEGERLLAMLVEMGLLETYQGLFYLSQFSRKYLHHASKESQLHVLEFERLLIDRWDALDSVLRQGQGSTQVEQSQAEYESRLQLFHKAMHEAAVVRSKELWDELSLLPETGLVIDVGAGDGTYLREFLTRFPGWRGVACDLADVITLGDYSSPALTGFPCNILDPADAEGLVAAYRDQASLLLLSNVVHCYSEGDNQGILGRLKELVRDDGVVVVHDFFTDANPFGALYDGHMLANTYNGRTYSLDDTRNLLAAAGFSHSHVISLPSFSCAVLAGRRELTTAGWDQLLLLQKEALELGLIEARPIGVDEIVVEPWVKAKCRYGCAMYGRKWSCPPHSMDGAEFQELLGCYREAVLVVGHPPLQEFQGRLLELEKRAFLRGLKKALVFSGGPCTWCESCPVERCRFPEKRRPSLEACGCDVFDMAQKCGVSIRPLKNRDDFVQYVGLLLVQ